MASGSDYICFWRYQAALARRIAFALFITVPIASYQDQHRLYTKRNLVKREVTSQPVSSLNMLHVAERQIP